MDFFMNLWFWLIFLAVMGAILIAIKQVNVPEVALQKAKTQLSRLRWPKPSVLKVGMKMPTLTRPKIKFPRLWPREDQAEMQARAEQLFGLWNDPEVETSRRCRALSEWEDLRYRHREVVLAS